MTSKTSKLSPQIPQKRLAFAEARALGSAVRFMGTLATKPAASHVLQQAPYTIVFPGFGTTDFSTLLMRRYLVQRGIPCEGWGAGRNLAGKGLINDLSELSDTWDISEMPNYNGEGAVPALCDQLTQRVRQRATALGHPVALIGWSLGGYVAREVARELPELVSAVVTMGAPVIGGPKYTAAAPYFKKLGQDLDWIEREIEKRAAKPIQQPVTAIFSKSDAVVDWRAAQDHHSPDVTHIEVDVAHMSMGFNTTVLQHVVQALQK